MVTVRNLYEITGNICDINTVLVNREHYNRLQQNSARYNWITDGKRGTRIWNHVLSEEQSGSHATLNSAIDAAIKGQ